MEIQLLPSEEIDKVKWNSCVHFANNGNIFGYKWYLDFVAKEWYGLIEGDYESVCPLVWRKGPVKGKELYQPPLMRELGIYSVNVLSPKRIRSFLDAIPEEYRLVEMVVNEQNRPPEDAGFSLIELTNHQLLLGTSYEEVEKGYSPELRQTLEHAQEHTLMPTTSLKPSDIAEFYKWHSTDRKKKEWKFHAMQRVMYNVLHRGWGFASGVMNEDKKFIAMNFFIYSHNKVMSFMPLQSPEGKEKGALVYLMDLLIRNHAARPMILDFNTQADDELALALGARPNIYYKIRKDRRWLGVF